MVKAAENLQNNFNPKKAIVGCDGYIDKIIHVVKNRKNQDEFVRVPSIAEYSQTIGGMANKSGSIEFVPVETKLGGNGPLLANALLAQNHQISYVGAIGKDAIHPIFKDFASKCEKVVSIADPGLTDCLEFGDGKIMCNTSIGLKDVTWDNVCKQLQPPDLRKLIGSTHLISFSNYAKLPNSITVIEGFYSFLSQLNKKLNVFVDLADISLREPSDLQVMAELLKNMNVVSNIYLGLNEPESEVLSKVLKITEKDHVQRAIKLRQAMSLTMVIIHPSNGAAYSFLDRSGWVDGPVKKNAKCLTGGGDNFNAGFCNGLLNNYPAE